MGDEENNKSGDQENTEQKEKENTEDKNEQKNETESSRLLKLISEQTKEIKSQREQFNAEKKEFDEMLKLIALGGKSGVDFQGTPEFESKKKIEEDRKLANKYANAMGYNFDENQFSEIMEKARWNK